jgi:hypothetical protein
VPFAGGVSIWIKAAFDSHLDLCGYVTNTGRIESLWKGLSVWKEFSNHIDGNLFVLRLAFILPFLLIVTMMWFLIFALIFIPMQ